MVQQCGETELDACAADHQTDLANPLWMAVPFAINLVAHLNFTPIQFGPRNLPLASVDILVVWTTIIGTMIVVWPYHKWVAVAQVPYLIWVSLATVLQLSITWMNWGRR